MEVTGVWRAAVADEELRRRYPDPGFDDGGWEPIAVPGHWRTRPAFSTTDGPLLYRLAFDGPRPAAGRRAWLTFDGLFYEGDVWLDGTYVGDTDGYFFPHTFEITEALRDRSEHVLAVEVACPPPKDRSAKRALTGLFQDWEAADPTWNPGGIWRPVHIDETGPVRITRLRVTCPEATPERAVLTCRALLDAAEPTPVTIRTTVAGAAEHVQQQTVATGENRFDWRVPVPEPRLWWPHALGDQPLSDVRVEVVAGEIESDARPVRTGIRQVRMSERITTVNGERIFLKGADHGPARLALSDASTAELEADIDAAKEAGLDLVRLQAHVTRPELYDAADRAGMLVWQDLPVRGGVHRSVRRQAVRQARELVDLLGHHPSIAAWVAHDEPGPSDALLDTSVRRAFEKADPSRPALTHLDVGHFLGWHQGHERDLARAAARWPRQVRFLAGFGAAAVPDADAFLRPDDWPDLDWDGLAARHGLRLDRLSAIGLDPAEFDTFDAWRSATQARQAEVLKAHIETLRRLKYRPAGGFAAFFLADCAPAVSCAVLDHERRPKAGFGALADACAPVIVVADKVQPLYRPGEPVAVPVHVVSDLRVPIEGARVQARVGAHRQEWEGDIPADDCVLVGTVDTVAPDGPGRLVLELDLEGPGIKAANRYESVLRQASV